MMDSLTVNDGADRLVLIDAAGDRGDAQLTPLLEAALEAGQPVFILSMTARLMLANRAYLRLMRVPPDDQAAIAQHIAKLRIDLALLRRTLERRGEAEVSSFIDDQHGIALHYEVRLFPVFNAARALIAIGGLYTDISAQVAAGNRLALLERRYHDLLRSTSDWAWETDATGCLRFASERATELFGQLPASMVGRTLASLLGDEDHASGLQALISLGRQPFRNRRLETRDARGQRRIQSVSGVPIFDVETGRFDGFRGTAADVTREVEAEERNQEARAKLEAALNDVARKNAELDIAVERAQGGVRAKTVFLANMSHELRTPLNAIIGFAEIIRNGAESSAEQRREYADHILSAGNHLLTLISDLLDLSQIDNETIRLEPSAYALGPLIEEALTLVRGRARGRNIELSAAPSDALTVWVDRTRLLQILLNLLTNAVKFTPAGGTISVGTGQAGDHIEVMVEDNGPGIPDAQREEIFEAFVQLRQTAHAGRQEGIGLGLSIARRLARLMGGDLSVTSEAGAGSVFTLTLLPAPTDSGPEPQESAV